MNYSDLGFFPLPFFCDRFSPFHIVYDYNAFHLAGWRGGGGGVAAGVA